MAKLNILLIAEESPGIQILRSISQQDHNLVAVLANPRTSTLGGVSVWDVARKHGYPTWPAHLVKEKGFANRIRELDIDLLLNVHSLYIVPDDVLESPRIGSFNLHPGPLPEYAGLNAVSWALYQGESSFGVTLHQMVTKIDGGPIISQQRFAINESDTAISLMAKCVRLGIPLVLDLIEKAAQGEQMLQFHQQNLSGYRYFGSKVPNSGFLDWSQTARQVINFIRACDYYPFPSPWGYPKAIITDKELGIIKAGLTGIPCDIAPGNVQVDVSGKVLISCQDEWVHVRKVKVNGSYCEPGQVLRAGTIFEWAGLT